MSFAISDNQSLQPYLPNDLFQHFILPDLLSQHLHTLLVDSDPPEWHAFYVLPLVSRLWYFACQSLFAGIFGIKRRPDERLAQGAGDREDSDVADPDDYDPSFILDYAMSVWKRARHPASKTAYLHHHNRSTLLADKSLIRVYTCLALGIMFLNEDVLVPLGVFESNDQNNAPVERTPRNAWHEDYEEETDGQFQRTSMDEASIHRCHMPFECAQRLCDYIAPERLAYIVAAYMAQVIPLYHMLPRLTRYAQDLQFNVDRGSMLDLRSYARLASHTLGNLEAAEELLNSMMMEPGMLVRSFWDEPRIPTEALKLTGIISVLDDVVRADWGSDTIGTRKRASALIRRWTVNN